MSMKLMQHCVWFRFYIGDEPGFHSVGSEQNMVRTMVEPLDDECCMQ